MWERVRTYNILPKLTWSSAPDAEADDPDHPHLCAVPAAVRVHEGPARVPLAGVAAWKRNIKFKHVIPIFCLFVCLFVCIDRFKSRFTTFHINCWDANVFFGVCIS